MTDPTEHFQRQWEDMDPATAEINKLDDEITALQARNKEAVETLRKGFKSCDPTKTAAAIILAIAQLEGHGE